MSFLILISLDLPKDQQFHAVQAAILLLPDENREALKILLFFLRDVVAFVEENQMTPTNIAVCLAPSLFHLNTLRRESSSSSRYHCLNIWTVKSEFFCAILTLHKENEPKCTLPFKKIWRCSRFVPYVTAQPLREMRLHHPPAPLAPCQKLDQFQGPVLWSPKYSRPQLSQESTPLSLSLWASDTSALCGGTKY